MVLLWINLTQSRFNCQIKIFNLKKALTFLASKFSVIINYSTVTKLTEMGKTNDK